MRVGCYMHVSTILPRDCSIACDLRMHAVSWPGLGYEIMERLAD